MLRIDASLCEMIHASSLEVTYFTTVSVEMFYLPVQAGETGAIEVTWLNSGTDQRALVAATIEGATNLEVARVSTDGSPQQDDRVGPNLAQMQLDSTQDSALLSALTVFGSGVPEIVGPDHMLDDHPTVPESTFHEMKFQAGHIAANGPGTHTFGFQNTNALGYMDYAMIVTSFTQVPEPGFAAAATRWKRDARKRRAPNASFATCEMAVRALFGLTEAASRPEHAWSTRPEIHPNSSTSCFSGARDEGQPPGALALGRCRVRARRAGNAPRRAAPPHVRIWWRRRRGRPGERRVLDGRA